jgi:hypothetical protein
MNSHLDEISVNKLQIKSFKENTIFWDVTLGIPTEFSRSFGGKLRFHVQVKE